MNIRPHIVSWFSCGTASATTTKLVLARYKATHDVTIARCIVPEEHPDNDRFAADCEEWFGQAIINLKSTEYESCEDVWARERYMSGIGGARCTVEMKKAVRHVFERGFNPDLQAFGYTVEEKDRVKRFREANPEVNIVTPLIDDGLDKEACHAIVRRAGIKLPEMYLLGFPNANCRGCVNAQSPYYWNLTRRVFPEIFDRRAKLSRELGVRLVKLTTGARERIYLDDLPPDNMSGKEPAVECSLLCFLVEQKISTVLEISPTPDEVKP